MQWLIFFGLNILYMDIALFYFNISFKMVVTFSGFPSPDFALKTTHEFISVSNRSSLV